MSPWGWDLAGNYEFHNGLWTQYIEFRKFESCNECKVMLICARFEELPY